MIRTNCLYTVAGRSNKMVGFKVMLIGLVCIAATIQKRYPMPHADESGFLQVNLPQGADLATPLPSATPLAPWQCREALPTLAQSIQWRVVDKGQLAAVAEDELHALIQRQPVPEKTDWNASAFAAPLPAVTQVDFVVPPGGDCLVPAAACPELQADILIRDAAVMSGVEGSLRKSFDTQLLSWPLFLIFFLGGQKLLYLALIVAGMVTTRVSAKKGLKLLQRDPARYLATVADNLRYAYWLASDPDQEKGLHRTVAMAALWAIIGTLEMSLASIDGNPGGVFAIAGLVKPLVATEPWRLLTGAMLHGSFMHLVLNILALLSFGKLIGRCAHYRLIVPVWLLGALGGSLCSWWLLPATSIGASGGLMGMMGFLLALGWKQRAWLPSAFMESLLVNLGLMVLIGVLAWGLIDNAAHAGGLLAGVLLGLVVFRAPGLAFPLKDSRMLNTAGLAAEVAFLGVAIFTMLKLLH
jgi:membrane associated rhomboid family serine protease